MRGHTRALRSDRLEQRRRQHFGRHRFLDRRLHPLRDVQGVGPRKLFHDEHETGHKIRLAFGNGLRLSLRAAARLSLEGIRCRVMDLRWLAPLPAGLLPPEKTQASRTSRTRPAQRVITRRRQ